jgi:hypothetical protein
VEVAELVGTDITDTRFGWHIPSGLAGPLDDEPVDPEEDADPKYEREWEALTKEQIREKLKDRRSLRRLFHSLPDYVVSGWGRVWLGLRCMYL